MSYSALSYLAITFFVSTLVFGEAKDGEQDDLAQKISAATSVPLEQVTHAVEVAQQAALSKGLVITGALVTSGINGVFFIDNDIWELTAFAKDPASGKNIQLPNVFTRLYDGGIKWGIHYKWVFAFLTNDVSVDELEGSVFGRGIGLEFNPGIGVEVGYLPGSNRPGGIILVQPKIGIGGGLAFPKMVFSRDRNAL